MSAPAPGSDRTPVNGRTPHFPGNPYREGSNFKFHRPTWFAVAFMLGFTGLGRAGLSVSGDAGLIASLTVYGACVVLSLIAARIARRAESGRGARVWSGVIGTVGLFMNLVLGSSAAPHAAASTNTVVIPFVAVGVVFLSHLVGEILSCAFPAREQPRYPAFPGRLRGWRVKVKPA
jgi:hypothetical protein